MPEFGFGNAAAVNALHVAPPSRDQVCASTPCLVRANACSTPPGCRSRLGWIASSPGPFPTGPSFVQVAPASRVSSKCVRQPSGVPSVLEALSQTPSANSNGLFFTGPRMPSGKRRGALQVAPSSADTTTIPHQRLGDGPTL